MGLTAFTFYTGWSSGCRISSYIGISVNFVDKNILIFISGMFPMTKMKVPHTEHCAALEASQITIQSKALTVQHYCLSDDGPKALRIKGLLRLPRAL